MKEKKVHSFVRIRVRKVIFFIQIVREISTSLTEEGVRSTEVDRHTVGIIQFFPIWYSEGRLEDLIYHNTKTDSTLKSFIMFIYRDLSDQNIWPLISNIILITSENRFSIRQRNINKWNRHETMKYETKIVWKIMELSNYMNPAVSWWSN